MKNLVFLGFFALVFVGCAAKAPEQSRLDNGEFQVRTYPVVDIKKAMAAITNVLQEEGYIIKEANTELGFLSAIKEMDVERKNEAFFGSMFDNQDMSWDKNAIIECTAEVTELSKEMRIQANFTKKIVNNRNEVSSIAKIGDEKFFKEFFSKLDLGILNGD